MFERLAEAVEEVRDVDSDSLSDEELGEVLVELQRRQSALEAAATRLTGAFDARHAWAPSGARSGSSWIAWKTHIPATTARRRLRLARKLRHMPAVAEAYAQGDIAEAHVSALAQARTPRAEELFAKDEELLVELATTLSFWRFGRALAYWSQLADPDGAEQDAEAQHFLRRCHVSESLGGMVVGDFALEPVPGAVVKNALAKVEQELFEADWAEAKARLGRDPRAEDLCRTPAQRRADALVELATRALASPEGSRRPAPLITVLVDYQTLIGRVCELADGTPVSPGSLVPLLLDAEFERVVFDSPARVLEVSQRRRLFEGALRRAIEVRDRTCFHPSCDTPAPECQGDHIVPWTEGGPTTQDNGRLACSFHNRNRHRRP